MGYLIDSIDVIINFSAVIVISVISILMFYPLKSWKKFTNKGRINFVISRINFLIGEFFFGLAIIKHLIIAFIFSFIFLLFQRFTKKGDEKFKKMI